MRNSACPKPSTPSPTRCARTRCGSAASTPTRAATAAGSAAVAGRGTRFRFLPHEAPPGSRSPQVFAEYAADVQVGVPGSTSRLYRAALRLRREHRLGQGQVRWVAGAHDGTLQFDNGAVRVVVSLGSAPVTLPSDRVVACQSGPLTADGSLPVDTAVWLVAREDRR